MLEEFGDSKRHSQPLCLGMSEMLAVNEIYLSLQGESTFAGLPCVFIRLTGCPLRCSYCDSAYAFAGGARLSLAEVLEETERLSAPFGAGAELRSVLGRLPLVELTGGEPLAQKASLGLMTSLCDRGYTVLLETSGALDIGPVDPRVHRIVDLKCPGSGEASRNRWENLPLLNSRDEVKFVISTQEDYAWAKEQIGLHQIAQRCPVLFSWAHPLEPEQRHTSLKPFPAGSVPISRLELAERVIAEALPVRFQVQMHKMIWPAEQRGV